MPLSTLSLKSVTLSAVFTTSNPVSALASKTSSPPFALSNPTPSSQPNGKATQLPPLQLRKTKMISETAEPGTQMMQRNEVASQLHELVASIVCS